METKTKQKRNVKREASKKEQQQTKRRRRRNNSNNIVNACKETRKKCEIKMQKKRDI